MTQATKTANATNMISIQGTPSHDDECWCFVNLGLDLT